jgi:hypothetical protein
MDIQLTADEIAFAASPQGKSQLAAARYHHANAERRKGIQAKPWTPALEAEATRNLAVCHRWGDDA